MNYRTTDEQLVKECLKGDQSSFGELMNRYTTKAFGLCLRLTKNREDAEEVLQDVFVTVYTKLKNFEGKSSFSSWLYRITVNAAFMKLRKRKQSSRVTNIDDLSSFDRDRVQNLSADTKLVDEATAIRELNVSLWEAINRLPEEYRPVFVLRDVDGLSTKQVGKILNLTQPAVKSRLHRSRMILRKRLGVMYRDFAPTDLQPNQLN